MLAALALAAAQCADPGYCPDIAAFDRARIAWVNGQLAAITYAAQSEPGDMVELRPTPVRRITNLRCGKPNRPRDGAPPKVRCSATLHYDRGQQSVTLLLSRTGEEWTAEAPPSRKER